MDKDKFKKLMMLAQSPEDFEALGALRKANEMLFKEGLNWESYIEQDKRQFPKPAAPEWRLSKKGNYWKKSDNLGLVTIFRNDSGYVWVNDGFFSPAFNTIDDAMEDFDLRDT